MTTIFVVLSSGNMEIQNSHVLSESIWSDIISYVYTHIFFAGDGCFRDFMVGAGLSRECCR